MNAVRLELRLTFVWIDTTVELFTPRHVSRTRASSVRTRHLTMASRFENRKPVLKSLENHHQRTVGIGVAMSTLSPGFGIAKATSASRAALAIRSAGSFQSCIAS